jgi:hypothetical protein
VKPEAHIPQMTLSDDDEETKDAEDSNHIEKRLNSLLEETRRKLVNFDNRQDTTPDNNSASKSHQMERIQQQ